MDLGPHAVFIIAAYAAAMLVIAVLVIWVVADHRLLTRMLAQLDTRGIMRRGREGAETP
jgi:heme exporter protein D